MSKQSSFDDEFLSISSAAQNTCIRSPNLSIVLTTYHENNAINQTQYLPILFTHLFAGIPG